MIHKLAQEKAYVYFSGDKLLCEHGCRSAVVAGQRVEKCCQCIHAGKTQDRAHSVVVYAFCAVGEHLVQQGHAVAGRACSPAGNEVQGTVLEGYALEVQDLAKVGRDGLFGKVSEGKDLAAA